MMDAESTMDRSASSFHIGTHGREAADAPPPARRPYDSRPGWEPRRSEPNQRANPGSGEAILGAVGAAHRVTPARVPTHWGPPRPRRFPLRQGYAGQGHAGLEWGDPCRGQSRRGRGWPAGQTTAPRVPFTPLSPRRFSSGRGPGISNVEQGTPNAEVNRAASALRSRRSPEGRRSRRGDPPVGMPPPDNRPNNRSALKLWTKILLRPGDFVLEIAYLGYIVVRYSPPVEGRGVH